MHERFCERIERGWAASEGASRAPRSRSTAAPSSARSDACWSATPAPPGAIGIRLADDRATAPGCGSNGPRAPSGTTGRAHSEGCYVLRTNVTDWTPEELWHTYIQLTEAEAAFRIHKSDLSIRPIWHQNDRAGAGAHPGLLPGLRAVEDPGAVAERAGLGNSPRTILDELAAHPEHRRRAARRRRLRDASCASAASSDPTRPRPRCSTASACACPNGSASASPASRRNVVPTFAAKSLKTLIRPLELRKLG